MWDAFFYYTSKAHIQAKRRKQDLKASVPRMKRERNPKVKTPWDGVFKERADAPRSGGDEPKAKAAESDITGACYLHHRKRYPLWDTFF